MSEARQAVRIALAGTPNCGKSTLFNVLTGARQTVGNWAGVTVERKEGVFFHESERVVITDLPGLYSLTVLPGGGYLDEAVSRRHLLSGDVDVVVNVLDATKLERTLYLTAQMAEVGLPMVVAVNLMDAARAAGIEIDLPSLAAGLNCPVVAVSAATGEGIGALKDAITAAGRTARATVGPAACVRIPPAPVSYDEAVERALAEVQPMVTPVAAGLGASGASPRWLAVKAIEGDHAALGLLSAEVRGTIARTVTALVAATGEDPDSLIADGRFGFAHSLSAWVVRDQATRRRDVSDAIDRVVLNRWLGLPIFLAVIYAMFTLTINVGGAFVDLFDGVAGTLLVDGVGHGLAAMKAPEWLSVLLAKGVGGGIQVVATFIPIIGFLFLILAFLEDSGYMARAAFLMDRFMRRIGLPGKAFVPLIVGFGCNVPAVMAARTLDQHQDRIMTIAMTPFMSCGARLAVYTLFVAAFFPTGGQNVVFLLYVAGVLAAMATGLVLKHTLLKGEAMPFMIELPAWRLPQPRSLLLNAWTRLKSFIAEAGRVIVAVVVLLSFLNSLGPDGSFGHENTESSVVSMASRAVVPAFAPMGLDEGNWPAVVGIVTGVFAKEAVVGTLNALYGGARAGLGQGQAFDLWAGLSAAVATVPANLSTLGDRLLDPAGVSAAEASTADSRNAATLGAMAAGFHGALGAFAYLLFVLLYAPCVATLGAIRREVGAGWTGLIAGWSLLAAYLAATTVYQVGTFAAHPESSALVLAAVWGAAGGVIVILRRAGARREAAALAAPAE